jgi:hypothetical protein
MPPAELAQAALASRPLTRARQLAEWIGEMRELTTTGVLRPAVAVQACQALGIELPSGKLRSAKDVTELQQAWEVAVAGELVLVTGNRVRAARDVAEFARAAEGTAPLRPDLAERALRGWVQGAGVPLGLPDDPCPSCLTVLHELSLAGKAVDLADLADAITTAASVPDDGEDGVCPNCGQVHGTPRPGLPGFGGLDYVLAEDAAEHAQSTVSFLVQFGAAATGPGSTQGGTAVLTPLGRLLGEAVIAGLAPAADAGAGQLVSALAPLPPKVAQAAAGPWLAARTPAAAVRELLSYAERAGSYSRSAALDIARWQGTAAIEAWREFAERPGFGAYARQWLSAQGEPAPTDDRDEAWLLVEAMVQAGEGTLPSGFAALVFAGAVRQIAGDDAVVAEVLAGIRDSGHPQARQVAAVLSGTLGLFGGPTTGPGLALGMPAGMPTGFAAGNGDDFEEGSSFQLKITLRGVSKPPVWRRVLVPAAIALDELHEVILRAMGWDGGHLHVFSDGMTEYGVPDLELGHADEAAVELADLVSAPGERVSYTYDFGDDWEHDIKLEKILAPDPAAVTPVCLTGKGACPPEDCGGAWGYADLKEAIANPDHEEHEELLAWLGLDDPSEFDPAEFSADEVNARLRHVRVTGMPR